MNKKQLMLDTMYNDFINYCSFREPFKPFCEKWGITREKAFQVLEAGLIQRGII